jgi:ribosome-associated protein
LAKKVAEFADETKAQDIVILDMRDLVNFCDFFVIATGTSDRQVKSIAEAIQDGVSENHYSVMPKKSVKTTGLFQSSQEGGAWVLVDMGNVVAHVFEPQAREFYGLEHLWQDAPKSEYKPSRKKK